MTIEQAQSARWQPNKRYDHAFAIVRVDESAVSSTPLEQLIVVLKVVRTQERAEQEVARLSELNQGKGSTYFWQSTRLERQ